MPASKVRSISWKNIKQVMVRDEAMFVERYGVLVLLRHGPKQSPSAMPGEIVPLARVGHPRRAG